MKNNLITIFIIILLFLCNNIAFASKDLEINSDTITLEKDTQIILLKGNVTAKDTKNNTVFAEFAKYDKTKGLFNTVGFTKIITSEGYEVVTENIYFDNVQKIISSSDDSEIIDKEGNKIFLKMFNYLIDKNLFFSNQNVNIIDINKNNYNFSEIYIDEKNQKIVGSDVKASMYQNDLKFNDSNLPRLYSNTVSINGDQTEFQKGIFTYCKQRDNNKCPPWIIQSEKIRHDSTKKTIFYDKATLKIYDFPIFYFPKLSHPDPTVKRRSGFLLPSLVSSSNLGAGLNIPYFYTLGNDKDITLSPRIYANENPLLLGEYRQDFKDAFWIVNAGITNGYKNNNLKKTEGTRTHLFSNFSYSFIDKESQSSDLKIQIQQTNNQTFLKAYDIESELVDNDLDTLDNTISYNYQNEDFFLSSSISMFENLASEKNSKYEYLLPYVIADKNLFRSQDYGVFDLNSKLKINSYEVDKRTELLVNDVLWKSKKWISDIGVESSFESILKTVQYNAHETKEYKNTNNNSELSGAIAFLLKYPLSKENLTEKTHSQVAPKFLTRYAPGHMRKLQSKTLLNYDNLYSLNKTTDIDVIERGLSATLGFEYKKSKLTENNSLGDEISSFSIGQIINEKENHELSSTSSMDQRFSDIVGVASMKVNQNTDLNYNFAIDQSYEDINYSEIGLDYKFNNTKFNVAYLEEKNHRGNQEYIKSEFKLNFKDNNALSFSTKRNLLSDSAEFYNFSYDYINDCLKAGLVFRREFYKDRDIEPENSIMFRIAVVPFGEMNSPKFDK